MSLPDQTPKLPKLPFLAGDALLIIAAWFIYDHSRGRLTPAELYAVVGCVAVGAILAAIPFLSDYARKQDEALDERQRGLEALSRTINTAAEQISIAANGMHEIVELAHRNLKHAEQLPQKLQEKVAEFNAQLDNAREDDREELEKELAELRASESERLQSSADKIHKDVAELAKLDAAVQKHLAARTELVARATDAIAQAQANAAAAVNDLLAVVTRELDAARSKALGEIDARLASQTSATVAAINAAADAASKTIAASVPATPPPTPAPTPAPEPPPAHAPGEVSAPPKKPRKSRREESPASETTGEPIVESASAPAEPTVSGAVPASTAPAEPPPEVAAEGVPTAPVAELPPPPASEPVDAPSPTPAEAPASSEAHAPTDSPAPTEPPPAPGDAGAAATGERPPRKRSPRKPAEPHAELPLDLPPDESSSPSDDAGVSRSEVVERVISSDGATRLIVTAYIGIGNRLFIRGEGPGLSWDRGVPLQFVSIGKWRWETMDATALVAFKLYKNDEIECAALGTLTLDPGHQQEVTAKF